MAERRGKGIKFKTSWKIQATIKYKTLKNVGIIVAYKLS
jgi:hypothetical protein